MPQAVYFVRYAHEMNGVWFPWAQKPSAYRASFAAVAGWFRAASCGAMMLWAPNWRACVSTTLVDKHIFFCSPMRHRHCLQQQDACLYMLLLG